MVVRWRRKLGKWEKEGTEVRSAECGERREWKVGVERVYKFMSDINVYYVHNYTCVVFDRGKSILGFFLFDFSSLFMLRISL